VGIRTRHDDDWNGGETPVLPLNLAEAQTVHDVISRAGAGIREAVLFTFIGRLDVRR
jgi:hypothetical protein